MLQWVTAVRKEIFIHFAFWFSFFIFVSLLKKWFAIAYWPFWAGGLIGTLLPDLDHVVYGLYLKPQELNSQRMSYMFQKRQVLETMRFLFETRGERTKLIFHTATFQLVFLVLMFWVMTSSGSFFGRGLVLAFFLHLLVDQIVDINETGGLTNWFRNFPFWQPRDKRQATGWWGAGLIVVLLFGFLL